MLFRFNVIQTLLVSNKGIFITKIWSQQFKNLFFAKDVKRAVTSCAQNTNLDTSWEQDFTRCTI